MRRSRLGGVLVLGVAVLLTATGCQSGTEEASPQADGTTTPTRPATILPVPDLRAPAEFATDGGFALAVVSAGKPTGAGLTHDGTTNDPGNDRRSWVVTDNGLAVLSGWPGGGLTLTAVGFDGTEQWTLPVQEPTLGETATAPLVRLIEEDGKQWIAVIEQGVTAPDPTSVEGPQDIVRVSTFNAVDGAAGIQKDWSPTGGYDPIGQWGSRTLMWNNQQGNVSWPMTFSPSTGEAVDYPDEVTKTATDTRTSHLVDFVGAHRFDVIGCANGSDPIQCEPGIEIDGQFTAGASGLSQRVVSWTGRHGLVFDEAGGPVLAVNGPQATTTPITWTCPKQATANSVIASPSGDYLVYGATGVDVSKKSSLCLAALDYTAVSDEGMAYADLTDSGGGVASVDLSTAAEVQRLPGVDSSPLAISADGHGIFGYSMGDATMLVVLPPAG